MRKHTALHRAQKSKLSLGRPGRKAAIVAAAAGILVASAGGASAAESPLSAPAGYHEVSHTTGANGYNEYTFANGPYTYTYWYYGAAQDLAAAAAAPATAPVAASPATPIYTTAAASITPIKSTTAAPASAPVSGRGATIANAAKAQVGVTQDCTALVEKSLRAAGVQGVGDESPESLLRFGTQTSAPQVGDMVYYTNGGMGFSHIAIYIGNGQAVHGGWNGNTTVIESVNIGSGPVFYHVN